MKEGKEGKEGKRERREREIMRQGSVDVEVVIFLSGVKFLQPTLNKMFRIKKF